MVFTCVVGSVARNLHKVTELSDKKVSNLKLVLLINDSTTGCDLEFSIEADKTITLLNICVIKTKSRNNSWVQ